MANAEQVGSNLQLRGRKGATRSRYAPRPAMSTPAIARLGARCARRVQLEGTRELAGHLGIGQCVRAGLGDDDHVCRRHEIDPVLAEDLAHDTFDAIANDGIPDTSAHRDTQPG